MGIAAWITDNTDRFLDSHLAVAREYFEPQLDALGLSVDKINQQDSEQLRSSLDRINDAIAHPESFGTLRTRIGGAKIFISESESHVEVGILPILLERKRLILDRLRSISEGEKIETLRDVVTKVTDPKLRQELEAQLASLGKQNERLLSESMDVAQRQQLLIVEKEAQAIQLEAMERRSKVWLSFLEKESASTLVGIVILTMITLCLIIALLFGRDTLQVLSNGFLVILGYFFGQASTRKTSP